MKPLNSILSKTTLIYLLAVSILLRPSLQASYKCNPKLLKTFKLQGLKYSVSQEMEICPTVRDTCCSIIDQVRIMELWKKSSFPRIKTHIENMKKWDHKVLGLHNTLRKLKKEDMIFFFKKEKMLPFHRRFCGMTTLNRELNTEEKSQNMEWMLPGFGIIGEYDLKSARSRAWREMKNGKNKDTPLYRFLMTSTRLFYEEFRRIARVMYYVNEQPFTHKKYIAARKRFANYKITSKSMPSKEKVTRRVVKKRTFKKKERKPEFYHFIDKNNKKMKNELDILYGRKKRVPERIKYGKRKRKKAKKKLKKLKSKARRKEAMKQYKKMSKKEKAAMKKKAKKKAKKGRRLIQGRLGRHLLNEDGRRSPETRELKDNQKAKTKQGGGGQTAKASGDKDTYENEPIPEIKIRRRKKKLVYAGGSPSGEEKGRKWMRKALRKRRKLSRKHFHGDRVKIRRKRKTKAKKHRLIVKMMKNLTKKGHFRRSIHQLKRKHKKEGRKLNNLKSQISNQWNNLFSPGQGPPQPAQNMQQMPGQMTPGASQMMQGGYSPQQLAQIAQMQQVNGQAPGGMVPQMMMPQQAQMQSPNVAQGNNFTQSPNEQGNIQYQNMQYSSQPGGQPVQINPSAYQNMPQGGYPWGQRYPQSMPNAQAQPQQPQIGISNGRILEEIKPDLEDQEIMKKFLHSPARNLAQVDEPKTDSTPERSLNLNNHLKALLPSDKEIIQKYKVTQTALEAMKSLKFKYGKKLYKKHMDEIKKKTKFFSNFVLKGDPVNRLNGLAKKLRKAVQMIEKRTGRNLILDDLTTGLFGATAKGKGGRHKPGLMERGFMLTKWNATFLFKNPSKSAPNINTLLKIIKYPKWKKFYKEDLKIPDLNQYLLDKGYKNLQKKVKSKFLSLGFPISRKYKLKFMLGLSKNYMKNIKKLAADRKNEKKNVNNLNRKIKKMKRNLKKAIKTNNINFAKLQAALAVPGEGPKPKDNDVAKTKIEVDLTVHALPKQQFIECGVSSRMFPYSEINFSKRKQRFCMRTYRRFRRIRIKEIIEYIELSRGEMRTILDMKKSMYCGVCDGTLQNNFDEERKLILYSQRFCQDLVGQFQDYIKFRNVILVNYYEDILQMLNCFTFSNQGGADFPVKTMLQVQKRRVKSIKRCFKHLRTPTFYKHCFWVCSQFSIMKFNSFFDGDPEMLKTIYMKFAMFLRKYKKYRQQIDGLGKKKKKRRKKRRRRRRRKARMLRYHGRPDYAEVGAQEVGKDGMVKGHPLNFKKDAESGQKHFQVQTGKEQDPGQLSKDLDVSSGPNTQSQDQADKNDKTTLQGTKKVMKSKNTVKGRKKKRRKLKEAKMSIADQISSLILKHKQKIIKKTRQHSTKTKLHEYRSGIKNKKIISTIHVPTAQELGIHQKKKNKFHSRNLNGKKKLLIDKKMKEHKKENKKDLSKQKSKSSEPKNEKLAPKSKTSSGKTSSQKSHPERILTSIAEVFANDIQNELLHQRLEKEENREMRQRKRGSNVFLTDDPEDSMQRELHEDEDRPRFRKKRGSMMNSVPKRRMKAHERIRRRISYLKLHTESDNLPRTSNYIINTTLNPVYREVLQQQPIYQQAYEPMDIQQFRPFFTYSIHGFNPLRTQELMQMDFKPQQIVKLTKLTNFKTEKLTRKAVLQYLNLSRDDMASFNNDFKMKIEPLHSTDHKSYHNTPPYPRWKLHNKFKKYKRDYTDEKKPLFKEEFNNPDMYHLRDHYRNQTTNDHVARLWYQMFGK